jgi:hypothetical protein
MNWKGKVKEKSHPLKGKKVIQESYTISFTQDGQTFSYDPVIRLNS